MKPRVNVGRLAVNAPTAGRRGRWFRGYKPIFGRQRGEAGVYEMHWCWMQNSYMWGWDDSCDSRLSWVDGYLWAIPPHRHMGATILPTTSAGRLAVQAPCKTETAVYALRCGGLRRRTKVHHQHYACCRLTAAPDACFWFALGWNYNV